MDWTDKSKDFLKKYYSILGPTDCADILGTTPASVRAAASRLKLTKSITKTHDQFCAQLNSKGIFLQVIGTYTGGDIPIKFRCFYGHEFEQRPRSILERGKCPECASSGFKDNLPGELYLIEFPYEGEAIYKLGITNKTAKERHQQDINKYKATICWTLSFSSGKAARIAETRLKKEYADFQENTGLLKSGNTETFSCYINKPEV